MNWLFFAVKWLYGVKALHNGLSCTSCCVHPLSSPIQAMLMNVKLFYIAISLALITSVSACHPNLSNSGVDSKPQGLFVEDGAPNIAQSLPVDLNIPMGLSAQFDIRYQGAFRVLAGGESSSNYAVGALAYNPVAQSIFMAGHDHHGAIAEFAVPKVLSFEEKASHIVKARVVQNYVRVLGKKDIGNNTNKITGMLFYDGQLLVNSEIWYDGSGQNKDNLQVISDANNLNSAHYKGMLQLSGGAKAAGYMSAIPAQWQSALGGAYLTGWASNYSITSRYSQGPSLYVFNPSDAIQANVNTNRTIATQVKMVFPLQRGKVLAEGGDQYKDIVSPIWSALAGARFGFIVPNSSIFMVIGRQGGIHGGIGYKIVQDNGRLCGGGCAKQSRDTYNYFWLFDMNDIIEASEPHNIKPFSYGKWSHPYDMGGSHKIIGGTFDSRNNRLFLSLANAARTGQYDRPPLILSYEIKAKSR